MNLHTPRCIGCLVWGTYFQIVQVLQSRGWLRSVHDDMAVDGDGIVQFDMFHARGDALLNLLRLCSGFATGLRGVLWSSMQNPCTERCDVGFLFVLTWVGDCKANFEGCYGPVCKIHARRDVMSDFSSSLLGLATARQTSRGAMVQYAKSMHGEM